ncbi:peptidyl-prolyl cis-trans isomerase FKBP19, chloroplastic isoform X4 [Carya illinoinensis]|uniref:peptidyl-prolyl cis-trans isomerase FKBP19, chloroplastic isoform X4 n=1 Tax=Carya illinoinensis TaxID=32201 RepID=UPI001C71F912|nr:peptidyl-prolyl cis-trans isomerase FKBP19, chloroplastic isoform X4 [Carya illinoinensis]
MASISVLASLQPSLSLSGSKFSTMGCCRTATTVSLHEPQKSSHSNICGNPAAHGQVIERRGVVISAIGILAGYWWDAAIDGMAMASEFTDMPAIRGKDYGKPKMRYPDYRETESGLQYKDLRVGNGPTPKMGETVVVDWDGFTIGYYGRIFEARNKTKGGSFEVIPAFEEAVSGMAPGGVRSVAGS